MEALARFVEYYNHERLHEAIPQMGARTLSKKIGPTVPEDLTTYTHSPEEPVRRRGTGTELLLRLGKRCCATYAQGAGGPWRPGSKRGKTRRPRGAQEGNEAACRARAAARAAPPFR